jgi:iron complex outermembrane receptor protein
MIFAEATNLIDNKYVDYGNVPQPGRWIRTGIRFKSLLKNNESK